MSVGSQTSVCWCTKICVTVCWFTNISLLVHINLCHCLLVHKHQSVGAQKTLSLSVGTQRFLSLSIGAQRFLSPSVGAQNSLSLLVHKKSLSLSVSTQKSLSHSVVTQNNLTLSITKLVTLTSFKPLRGNAKTTASKVCPFPRICCFSWSLPDKTRTRRVNRKCWSIGVPLVCYSRRSQGSLLVERRTRDRKVASSSSGRSGGRSVLFGDFLCWLVFGVRSIPCYRSRT